MAVTHTHTVRCCVHSPAVLGQRARAQAPSSHMTLQRRGELMEINGVASAPVAARHQWCSPDSAPHLHHVFITPGRLSLGRATHVSPVAPSASALHRLVPVIFSSERSWIFQSAEQRTGLFQRGDMLQILMMCWSFFISIIKSFSFFFFFLLGGLRVTLTLDHPLNYREVFYW